MNPEYLVENASEIPSPALLVYVDKVRQNIRAALEVAGSPERLRPHIKTHKLPQIIELKKEAGITKFKCATIAEAELLARSGVRDILIAYPIIGPHIKRLIKLASTYPEAGFKVLADDLSAIEDLSRAASAAGLVVEVMLDLDVGMHRTGVAPGEEAVELYEALDRWPGLAPGGLHGYDGHLLQTDLAAREEAAGQCRAAVMSIKGRLEKRGLSVPRVVMAGTPSFPCHAKAAGIELSPGTVFFMDHGYRSLFPDLAFAPAALLLARVISRPTPTLITLDLGSKAIAADPAGERGQIWNLEYQGFYRQSEEHWTVEVADSRRVKVGQEVYVFPTHVCPTFAWQQEVYAVDGQGRWHDTWPVVARDRRLSL